MGRLQEAIRHRTGCRCRRSGLSILVLALLISTAKADPVTVIGIDITVKEFNASLVINHVLAYVDQNAKDGEPVTAYAIYAHTFTQPMQLAAVVIPKAAGIKGKDRAEALRSLRAQLRRTLDPKSMPLEFLRRSRISDFFVLAANSFETDGTPKRDRRMMLVSDMLQVDDERNWEIAGEVSTKHMDLPKIGGRVWVYGVQGPKYPNAERWDQIQRAWLELLDAAGIRVVSYANTYLTTGSDGDL